MVHLTAESYPMYVRSVIYSSKHVNYLVGKFQFIYTFYFAWCVTCKEILKYIYSDKFSIQSKLFCSWYADQDATGERDCLRELKERSETGIWWVPWSWQSQRVAEMCLFLRWSFSLVFPLCFISGFVIVGEDNTGKLDLGIFIASIVPDGPADKDGRIKPGLKHRQTETKQVCMWPLMKRILFYCLFVQVDASFL